jgi:hypothetical protein
VLAADDEGGTADDTTIRIKDRNGVGSLGSRGRQLDSRIAEIGERGEEYLALGKARIGARIGGRC